jgi:protein TonB
MNADIPLAQFARAHRPYEASSRAMAGALTALLYGLLALLAWLLPPPSPPKVTLPEITAILLPDTPRKMTAPPPPPFLARLIKPHAETVAPPAFIVASAPPTPAPAQLPASAATASPLAGGAPSGTSAGDGAVSGSANGANGNGKEFSGCFDAAWGRAVTDRVGHFYHYPRGTNGATGVVMIQFTVRRSGWLDTLKIGKSSGNDTLDRAAYETVRWALPLPAIPDRMHAERISVELPISFGAQGNFQPTPRHLRQLIRLSAEFRGLTRP